MNNYIDRCLFFFSQWLTAKKSNHRGVNRSLHGMKILAFLSAALICILPSTSLAQSDTALYRGLCEEINDNLASYMRKTATHYERGSKHEIVGFYDGTQVKKISVEIVGNKPEINFYQPSIYKVYYFEGSNLLAVVQQYKESEWRRYYKNGKLFKSLDAEKKVLEPDTDDFRYDEKNDKELAAEFQKALQEKGKEDPAPK